MKINKPMKVYTCQTTIDFKMTSSEAYEVLKNPKGKVAKSLRKYLSDFLTEVAKKTLAYEKEIKDADAV